MRGLTLCLSLVLGRPAIAAADYQSCILVNVQNDTAYKLLACDGQKIAESAPGRGPASVSKDDLADTFKGLVSSSKLKACKEHSSESGWFKSCARPDLRGEVPDLEEDEED